MGDLLAFEPVRPSNSGPSLVNETPAHGFASPEHGIDTVRLRWRDAGGPGWVSALESAGGDDVRHSRAMGSYLKVGDAVVGAYDATHAYVEARAALLLDGRDSHRLVGIAEAPDVATSAAQRLAEVGIAVRGEDARVARLDTAAGLVFDDPAEGLAMMRALLHTDLPWLKAGGEGIKRNSVETVYWRAAGRGRKVLRRTYDKGVESQLAPPGALLRDESEMRFPKLRERWLHEVTGDDLRTFYVRRHLSRILDPRTATDVVICNTNQAITELGEACDDGTISVRTLNSLAGFLVAGRSRASRPAWYATMAKISRLGIEIDDAQEQPRRVPLGTYFRYLVDQWAA